MKRIFTHLFVAVLLMLSTTSWAQLENGKVYRIVCSGTTSVSLGASALTDVAAVSTSETDKSQQWYVTVNDGNHTFRNLANGRYLLGNNGTSGEWGLTEDSNNFTVSTVNNNYCIRQNGHANGYAYMHKDAGNNIVSWESSAGNSQWTMHEVSYSTSELDAVWAKVESLVVPSTTVDAYEGYLDVLFSDKSCVTPKLATLDAAKANDAYKNLPAALQKMVDKVYGGDWTESTVAPADRPNGNNNTNHSLWTVSDTWNNDYAKRFRVQMYEPYSIEGEITSYLRFNAHCNMDNPTGIYADGGEPIYIMVEGTVEEGAELWIAHQTGHGATGYYSNVIYTRLHEGLNVVPYFNDGSQLWINYLVHTYNASGATIDEKFPHKLSDYKPLKIHIEGGHINGYYNAIGDFRATDSGTENLWGEVDNDEDWNYYKARVALSTDFALLGHRQTPLFPFGTYESDKNAFCTYNEGGGLEYALAYHLDNITVPSTPNCYGGSGNTFGTFVGSYSGMNLSASNGKINIMLEAWDRIMYSELATMGLVSTSTMEKMNSLYPRWTSEGTAAEIYNYGEATVNGETKTYKDFCQGLDYSEYFNHHGAAVGAPSGYMSGGWRVCNYHYNTMGSVIGKIAAEAGPTWGPAHEIGHQHQGVFNLNGQTEVTNNFFSNVAVWYMGMGTSRVNGSEGSLASVLAAFNTDGNDLYTNNIWAITHLYYRLWLYYHLAGNNTQFWPRLFELCRQVPLVNGGQISGETSLLRFYQHACDAAGEDLTEFFRAHGYFEIMDNRFVGDYSNATYNITQEQIDAAIKSVKDKGYPVNYAALLINDATSETTVKHDGATKRSLWDGSATADLGSVNDFIDGDIETLTNYTAAVSTDGTVTMSGGEGGIGFLVLNEKGELVSFSNKTEFALSDEAAYLLATGKATIVAVDTDSETAEAEVDLSAIQREMLEALIEKIEAMPIDDGTYTHIGFYTKACATDLLAAVESAKTVLASGTGFVAAYELLYTAKEKFVNSPSLSYVPFDPSLTYIITNYAYKDKTMYLNSGVSNTGIDKTLNTSKWQFKTTGTDGVYNLYNVSGSYLAAASKSTLVSSVSDQASAATYSLIQDSPVGTWAISVSPAAEFATLHDNSYGNVVGWEAGASASKWYLTAVEGSTNSLATQASDELQALIAKTETLMNEVATVSLKGKVQLQADNANSAFFITSNATEGGHEPKYLLDNNVSTFFHTVWTGTSPGADHYLQIDLGEELPIDQFVLKYTNLPSSSWNVDAANTIKVQGANILDEFTDITTLTDLPTAKEGTYTSATLGAKGTNYRYIRLTVTNATGGKFDNHYYFGMSEFSLERLNSYSKVKDAYTDHITQNVVATVADKLVDAKTVIANGGDIAAAKTALQDAYDALLLEYNGVADAKKKELQDLIDATNGLIAQVGEATVIAGANVDLLGKLYAEREYTAGGTSHSDYSSDENGYNLLDGDVNTHFHSDYNFSSMVSPPYLRVDLGKGNSARKVNFNYTTRNKTGCAPKIINVYGGVAGVEYSQGAIQSSAALNAVTTPTKIVIKNLSGTNGLYFAGKSNVAEFNAAVLVWEPVEVGVAGRYYLRTTDAESGYIQASTEENASVTFGAKGTAQVFHTSAPVSGGSGENAFATETLATGSDTGNLVRFVQDGKSTWLNVNSAGDLPRLGNSGTGGWTVHNVYLVTETENDTPLYDENPIATFTTGDASNPLPTGTSVKWTSADIASTKDYRFFKFEVAESQGSKTENGNTKYYFAISEFGFNIVGEYSVTINPEYQGLVSEDLLIETRQEVDAAVTMKNIATSEDLLQVQIDKLQAAYDALNEAMFGTETLKKQLEELLAEAQVMYQEIADVTEGVLNNYYKQAITEEQFNALINEIQQGGDVHENTAATADDINAAINELQTVYDAINSVRGSDVADRSSLQTLITEMEDLLELTTVDGAVETGNVALQVDSKTSPYYIWTYPRATDDNGLGALIDEIDGVANTGTFAGTYWQPESKITEAYSHYVEIDLGINTVLEDFAIDYTTRYSGAADSRPTGLKFYGSNDKEDYTELFSVTEGLPADANTKWEMSEPYKLEKNYRYIRVAVTSSHERHCFNMSDFNLYANSVATVNEFYSTSDIFDCLPAVLRGYRDAKDAVAVYLTQDEYDAAKTALQAHIDVLQAIVDGNVTDKKDLETLVGETEPLVTEAATISTIEEEITMQCTDANAPYYLYCNAEGKDNGGDDALGVSALVGENKDNMSHLHTAYKGNTDDNLDHYLRLDMGEEKALMSFKFSYTGRNNSNNNAPVEMVIEGSNDLENFEAITTLTELPTTAATVTYATDEALTNGKAYRYVRFMVTKTNNNAMYNDHPFFVLSKFSVTACKTVEVNANPNMPLNTLVTAHNEAVEAKAMVAETEHYVTQTAYNTAVDELQAAKDALAAAIALKNIPVKLTTDVNNPVLYKIRINRSYAEYASLQYDASDSKVAVAAMEFATANAQSWYFMQGTVADSYEDILILPYVGSENPNTTLRLAAEDISNGAGKVMAVEENNATYQNWYITVDAGKTAEGWWNIRPEGDNYFSNHSGNGNKMGFYNSSSDDGSEFKFVLDEAYAIVEEAFASYGREPEYTDVPGYPANSDYNTAYDALANYVENKSGEDAEVFGALQTLVDAETAMTYVKSHSLEHGAVYRIMNLITNTETQYKYHYIANNKASISFPTGPADDGSDLWVCKANEDSTYVFVSALGTLSLAWKSGGETSHAFKIDGGVEETGAKSMRNSSKVRMALTNEKHNSGLAFNHASSNNAQDTNWSTDWFFQRVDAEVAFNVSISSRRFSSLYLPYNVTVPAGVSAFTAVAVDGGYVDLFRVADNDDKTAAGDIIPARTPVILYIEDDNEVPASSKAFVFEFTASDASLSQAIQEQIDEAIIYGKILQTPIQCVGNARYYKLGSKSGDEVSKMYWMYKEYSSDGTIASGNAGTDNGGYIRCSANKIYMKVDGGSAANSFSMRFAGATTGIDEVNGENGEVKAIYDMQGRKLTEITMPGVYIVNGKKTIVK